MCARTTCDCSAPKPSLLWGPTEAPAPVNRGDDRHVPSTPDDGLPSHTLSGSDDLVAIHVEMNDGEVVVHVAGEVDLSSAPLLASKLREAVAGDGSRPAEIVVDLGEVSFLDAQGLAALQQAGRLAAQAGGKLSLARPSNMIRRLLGIAGLQAALPVLEES